MKIFQLRHGDLYNSNISWMYYAFMKNILHNFQIFEDFICTLLLLISNLIVL